MRIPVRYAILVLDIFFYITFTLDVLSKLPFNPITAPVFIATLASFVITVALVLGWDYILPYIMPGWRLGTCRIVDRMYVVCERSGTPGYVGYVGVKVVPMQPVIMMPKEQRESLLQSVQGLLSGASFEVIVAYVGVRDRYRETVIDRLETEKNRLLHLAFRESPALREAIRRIDEELRLLKQTPTILEGFYVAFAREYGATVEELIGKLSAALETLQSTLSGRLGARAVPLKGEELKKMIDYIMFGQYAQE